MHCSLLRLLALRNKERDACSAGGSCLRGVRAARPRAATDAHKVRRGRDSAHPTEMTRSQLPAYGQLSCNLCWEEIKVRVATPTGT